MYRELWRGSSGERDVLEGYLFKYNLFCYVLNNCVCNPLLALLSVGAVSGGQGRCVGSGAVLQQLTIVGMAVPAQLVLCS